MGGRTGSIDTAIKSVTGDTPIIIMEEGIVKHTNKIKLKLIKMIMMKENY